MSEAPSVAQLGEAIDQRFEIWAFLFAATRVPEIADRGNLSGGLRMSDA